MGVNVRLKDGEWYIFINHNKKRKAKCFGAGPEAKKTAEEARRKIEAQLALGDLHLLQPRDHEPTFQRFAQKWQQEHVALHLKDNSDYSYDQLLRLYLIPRFGSKRLRDIQRSDIKRFLAEMAKKTKVVHADDPVRRQEVLAYSRNTLRLMLATIRTILSHAVNDRLIDSNPASAIGKIKTDKEEHQANFLTEAESSLLLQTAYDHCPEYYALFLVALRSGLRRGELVALKWGDVQFGSGPEDPNRFIYVRRSYSDKSKKFTTPKGKRSRRVDMSQQVWRELYELRERRLFKAFSKDPRCTGIADEFVFPSQRNTVLNPANLVNRIFLTTLEKSGLRRIRFHDLRHTFGSLLIQAGASLTYVKEQMGHSSIKVTVDIYGHLVPSANVSFMDLLDEKTRPQRRATQTQLNFEEKPEDGGQAIEKNGADDQSRTGDLLITNQLKRIDSTRVIPFPAPKRPEIPKSTQPPRNRTR